MPSDDRDQQFDRALARHLRSASPDAACPDAEVLAAYHERSLSFEEMARWKAHIASCLRCQETLALLEETDSVAANDWEKERVPAGLQANRSMPAGKNIGGKKTPREMLAASAVPAPVTMSSAAKAAEKPGRRVPWSIAVPAGALAAGLLVWAALHVGTNFLMKKDANVQVAENRQTLPPVSSTAPQTLKAAPRDEGAHSLQPGIRTDRKTSPALTSPALPAHAPTTSRLVVPGPAEKESGASQQDNLGQLDVEKSAESLRARAGTPSGIVAGKRAVAAAPAPPKAVGAHGGGPLVANQMQNQMQNQNMTQNANQASTQSADLAGNPPLAGEKKDAQAAQKQKGEAPALYSTTGGVEVSAAEAPFTGRASSALRLRNGNIITITAPNRNQAWRIGPAGRLEHSTDTGRSWNPQTSGVTADLLAGSAPSDRVCWIAGKAGTLLLTTDGGNHWKRIASPIADDLGGVRALDAQHAAIWDVPNSRSFETTDGGLTWKLLASQ